MTADKSVSAQPLRLGKRARRFDRGLGTHAPLVLTYESPQGSRFLASIVGVSHRAQRKGSVVVSVELDGDEVFRSPTITGKEEPIRLMVPINGARTITLRLHPTEDGKDLDHVDWAMARFVRRAAEQSSGRGQAKE